MPQSADASCHFDATRSSESVVDQTRDSVRSASAFVAACTQLGAELATLEQIAEQTCAWPQRMMLRAACACTCL